MSELIVEVVKIDEVAKHPNADRLDLVRVKGWHCVAGRDNPKEPKYKAGDKCIYIPIDSILDEKLESYLFPPDGKIHLTKHRIKTIKLRGAISQGMVIDIGAELESLYPGISKQPIGADVAKLLNITKYEPPAASIPNNMKGRIQPKNHPDFSKYTDIQNFKHYPDLFSEDELVYVTEKLHGTSARYAMLPTHTGKSWWKKLLKWLHLLPQNEFCYGSRNVQLHNQILRKKLFYSSDVYARIAKELQLQDLLEPGECLYGEIVGHGIQKDYNYGCKPGELRFFAYDVKVDGKFLDPLPFMEWCDQRGIERVPLLHIGQYLRSNIFPHVDGDSVIKPQKVREGIVIKPCTEGEGHLGRRVLKLISDDYLLGDQTELH